jgi:hemerythrin
MARTWTPKLAIGVPAIDRQHQELFRRADDLLGALSRGDVVEELVKLIDFLGQYVHVHFKAEEALMAGRGYPELSRHQLLHQQFTREFDALRVQLTKGASSRLGIQLNQMMGGWLVNHIGTEDAKIAAFLGQDSEHVTL